MNEPLEPDLQRFEAEFRKVQPAPAPDELINRLLAHRPGKSKPALVAAPVQLAPAPFVWGQLLRRLIPAAAMGLLLLVILRHPASGPTPSSNPVKSVPTTMAKEEPTSGPSEVALTRGDELEIGRTWIATYDAVAELPTGEPVRFRCREWADTTVFRDKARGIAVERSTPRLEIVPISFDTY